MTITEILLIIIATFLFIIAYTSHRTWMFKEFKEARDNAFIVMFFVYLSVVVLFVFGSYYLIKIFFSMQ